MGSRWRSPRKALISLACLVFLVALSGSVSGANITSCGTVTETSTLGTDLTSIGTCLTIGANDITLDCQSYSINGTDASGSYGIYASGRSGVIIKNCNIRDYQYGIYLDSSDSNTLENNTVSSNTQWGIILDSSSNNIIANNKAYSNGYDGILLDTSSNNNTLTNNNASLNTWFGIYLDTSSEYNILDNNTVSSNSKSGIVFTFAGTNTIINNNVNLNNDYGIDLSYSSNNIIYNNFFNNTDNFFLSSSPTNTWNTTKIAGTNIVGGPYFGGNYWAKPDGTGFSETCTDADIDGICGSSYTLASSNVDYLPLTLYPFYFNASVEPTIVAQGESVTASAMTNYNYATMWVNFTWYNPNGIVQQTTDTTNESGMYLDTYTTTIEDETGLWNVTMEFITSGGVQATRYAEFTVNPAVPEFSFLALPLIVSFLIYTYMRRKLEGGKI